MRRYAVGQECTMSTIDTTDYYLVLACPVLANGLSSGEFHILTKCTMRDEHAQDGGDTIIACDGPVDVMDFLLFAPDISDKPVVRPDWAQVAREHTLPNQSERRRENMPVSVVWARKEQWDIWASER